jgi:hypothetical protein
MNMFYMHTLDGMPAYFVRTDRKIYFAPSPRSSRTITLCRSLRQIKAEQKASIKTDLADGRQGSVQYGYVRVRLPAIIPFRAEAK